MADTASLPSVFQSVSVCVVMLCDMISTVHQLTFVSVIVQNKSSFTGAYFDSTVSSKSEYNYVTNLSELRTDLICLQTYMPDSAFLSLCAS